MSIAANAPWSFSSSVGAACSFDGSWKGNPGLASEHKESRTRTRFWNKKSNDRLMYAPRRWALKKRSLLVWGKYFVLRFPSLDCLVYFDPGRGRRERCPEDGLD